MNIDIENLKKRILYRSQYRGTKEMDKLMFSFVSKYINQLNETKLLSLEKFLNIDDEDLYRFYNNLKDDLKFEDEYIKKIFKSFKFIE